MGQIKDDYHATVSRYSDKNQLVFISDWRWLLKWKIRRKALDRAYKRFDKRQRKMAEVERFNR